MASLLECTFVFIAASYWSKWPLWAESEQETHPKFHKKCILKTQKGQPLDKYLFLCSKTFQNFNNCLFEHKNKYLSKGCPFFRLVTWLSFQSMWLWYKSKAYMNIFPKLFKHSISQCKSSTRNSVTKLRGHTFDRIWIPRQYFKLRGRSSVPWGKY